MSRMSIKRRNIEKTKIKGQKAPKRRNDRIRRINRKAMIEMIKRVMRRNEHKWFNVLIFIWSK